MVLDIHIPAQRILDFDIENRPISYGGGDWTFADITAIAAGWANEGPDSIEIRQIGVHSYQGMLKWFSELWAQADIVTGHYILGHDIGHIQGALVEFGMPTLGQKMVSDTKNNLIRFTGISKSQENLCQYLGIDAPKEHMNEYLWRQANRLTPEGLMETSRRVVGDVKQHMEMRSEMVRRGLLKPPRVWNP